jgi:hypothetical protein
MKNSIYILFNTLACRYSDIFNFPTDSFAISRIKKALTPSNNPNDDTNIKEHLIFKIGELDIETATIIPCSPVAIPWEASPNQETPPNVN